MNRNHVLLTGATGMVGGLVLADLLRAQIPVAVLVRGNVATSAAQRVERVMQKLERRFSRCLLRPRVIEGDLTSEGLGISASDREWVGAHCGTVMHSAACLSFKPAADHPQHEPFRSNLEGTRTLLSVAASAGIANWHYISTAYVSGLRTGRVLESEGDVGQQFANDYERSKLRTEELLLGSSDIESLTIYRPSIIVDDHVEGAMPLDQTINGAFSTFQVLCSTFGLPERGEWLRNLGFDGTECKNVVPADWVARMIVQIARRRELHGRTYHLTSDRGTTVAAMDDAFRAVVDDAGTAKPRRVNGSRGPSIDELAAPYVSAFAPYFRDDPEFDRTNLHHAMIVCNEDPAAEINEPEVRHLVQNTASRQRQPTGRPVEAEHASVWQEQIRRLKAAQIPASAASGLRIGVRLSGIGGGHWIIRLTDSISRIEDDVLTECELELHVTSGIWNELLDGRVTLEEAVRDGRLTVESNGSAAWKTPVTQLLASLRAECQASPKIRSTARTNPEVTRAD